MMVNSKLERICKKAFMACVKVLSQNLPERTEENHKGNLFRIASLWNEIQTWGLLNTEQEC